MMLLLDPTPAFAGAGSAGPWLGAQESGGSELPGRAVRGPVQWSNARFQGVRQDPDSAARRDRRQQAAVGRVGAGQGPAGRLSGASAARAHRTAAAAEHPRGARSAVEGARTTPPCGCGLRQRFGTVLIATAAFVFHLTEMLPAKPASTVSWQGGFFRYREIYPDGLRRWWLGNAGWREPTSSDRLPSIGVSLQPAIPRRVAPQQSPLPLHQSAA